MATRTRKEMIDWIKKVADEDIERWKTFINSPGISDKARKKAQRELKLWERTRKGFERLK
jgi:hypothetical protein